MTISSSDQRIESIVAIPSPATMAETLPTSEALAQRVVAHRSALSGIISGKDKRLLAVVGPCSIHDTDAAMEYAGKLSKLRQQYANSLNIVMRVYFEKPRTTIGWKGLINDPDINGTFNIEKGLLTARQLLIDINDLDMPAGCEFLDAATGQYYADTVSWGAIGARTTESQIHRELASGLSCPVGFKNGTNGNIDIAIDAVKASEHPHAFLSPDGNGQLSLYKTSGNNDAHIILRGGREPNYHHKDVVNAFEQQQKQGIKKRLIIDCSHANSAKDYINQSTVLNDIANRLPDEISMIGGIMLESHLIEGKQSIVKGQTLNYGQSITDACIGWQETEDLLGTLANAVAKSL